MIILFLLHGAISLIILFHFIDFLLLIHLFYFDQFDLIYPIITLLLILQFDKIFHSFYFRMKH